MDQENSFVGGNICERRPTTSSNATLGRFLINSANTRGGANPLGATCMFVCE